MEKKDQQSWQLALTVDEGGAPSRDGSGKGSDCQSIREIPGPNYEDQFAWFCSQVCPTNVREYEATLGFLTSCPFLEVFDVMDDIILHSLDADAGFELGSAKILVKCFNYSIVIVSHQPV